MLRMGLLSVTVSMLVVISMAYVVNAKLPISMFSANAIDPTDPEFCDCVLDVKDRQDCGAEKITPKQCKAMGCCYNRKPHKAVWCFKKRARNPIDFPGDCLEARDNVTLRIDCGWKKITEDQCKLCQFCCWDKAPHYAYCYKRKLPFK